jgi:hypothetical protein
MDTIYTRLSLACALRGQLSHHLAVQLAGRRVDPFQKHVPCWKKRHKKVGR